MRPVLVVDDDPRMRAALEEAIRRIGFPVEACGDGVEAVGKLARAPYSLVVTDMKMPRMGGLELLREIRRRGTGQPVLVITGYGTVENAVEAMRDGAADYLLKPFSFETLRKAVEAAMARAPRDRDIVTKSRAMEKVLQLAATIAPSDVTVLVTGESGTGKELLARSIHRMSRRAAGPFVAVNCAAIPETLMESELFGHEKGAFTGAVERRQGKMALAAGGTILLDEIGEMPLALQAKLLRVLQEREIDRIGGKDPIPLDVRVIATTNRDLEKECLAGRFREDLFYRLNVFPLRLPPLRERPEDIPLLAEHFIRRYAAAAGKAVSGLSAEAAAALAARPWRGNVRELENVIHRAVFLARGETIEVADLGLEEGQALSAPPGGIREMERELILRTLREVGGNKTRAAKILGVTVRTIRNKLHEYGAGA